MENLWQILATQIGFTNGTVFHYGSDRDLDALLWAADVIVYSSLREEQAFPNVLLKAMVFEHPIIAPNITVIRDEVTVLNLQHLGSFYGKCDCHMVSWKPYSLFLHNKVVSLKTHCGVNC